MLLVLGLVGGACGGGGDHKPKPGTPAATGIAPDCATVAPLDLVNQTLDLKLEGPTSQPSPSGTTCTYGFAAGKGNAVQTVLVNSNVDKASFAIPRDGLKAANNPVKKIGGWGDEAYAATVYTFVNSNIFGVRKGRVSVVIQSTSDYDHLKKLMTAVLAKL